ncbi:hypothetical protein KP509_07G036900 [Ceratopteris richardii]|uniref:Uncharacterized protein n=1 Tax=Ceratopteris richardii TaxID=49495 RepID=A0A8T2UDZ0_CERRI|nr:hypothetical protein KP509_07G036900 [Ceratopteris richardii]
MQCATIIDKILHTLISLSQTIQKSRASEQQINPFLCVVHFVCCAHSVEFLVARMISWFQLEGSSLYIFVNPACRNAQSLIQRYSALLALLLSRIEQMASSLRFVCIMVLLVALLVAHSHSKNT